MANDPQAAMGIYDECYLDLRVCREQFESIRRDVEDLVATLTPRQLLWRPPGDAWSILECLAHLVELATASLQRVREPNALALSEALHRRGPARIAGRGQLLKPTSFVSQRADAPGKRPVAVMPEAVLVAFRRVNDLLLRTIDQAAAGTGGAATLAAGIGHGLQLAALQHWRHILEARRVTERPGFPGAL